MTHDTGHPREKVEEREHGVFVPPDEQHVREDGTPTEPAESAEWSEHSSDRNDADRVEAIGTEAVPHPPETSSRAYLRVCSGVNFGKFPCRISPERPKPGAPTDAKHKWRKLCRNNLPRECSSWDTSR